MKEIKCSFTGCFYVEVEDEATPREIEHKVIDYMEALQECVDPHAELNQYDWSEVNV